MRHRSAVLVAAAIASLSQVLACGSPQHQRVERPHDRLQPKYSVRLEPSVLMPMCDGVKLSADLYLPEGVTEKVPVVLIRTPCNKNSFRSEGSTARMPGAQGYVVAG